MWHGDLLHEIHMEALVACLGGGPTWKRGVKHLGGS
jgi:hypothetical protein